MGTEPGHGGVFVPQHYLVLSLEGESSCSHLYLQETGGQTDTWAPLPVSVEKEPCCPQHRQFMELPWPQDPSC